VPLACAVTPVISDLEITKRRGPRSSAASAWNLSICSLLDRLLSIAGTGGNLTTDAHLAALAIEHQCELHSNDNDFARFPGLRWRNPL
jgi:predicted nucleic acid-binding protein